MVEYSSRLLAAMDARGIKRTKLAKELGVSYVAVKKVLDGTTRAFTAENNSRAAAFLGVNPDWLATGEGEMLPTGGKAGASSVATTTTCAARTEVLLAELQTIVEKLAPVLQEPGRAALLKWVQGHANPQETAATLHAYEQASKALPTAPMAMIETPVRHPNSHD